MRKSYQVDKSFTQKFEDDLAGEGGELNDRINKMIQERTDLIHQ